MKRKDFFSLGNRFDKISLAIYFVWVGANLIILLLGTPGGIYKIKKTNYPKSYREQIRLDVKRIFFPFDLPLYYVPPRKASSYASERLLASGYYWKAPRIKAYDYTEFIFYFLVPVLLFVAIKWFIFIGNSPKRTLQKLVGAIAEYTMAIEKDPKLSSAYFYRGIAKHELQDYRGALADYNKAIEIDPTLVDVYLFRGKAKSDLFDHQGAIADYDKVIEIDPKHARAYCDRGVAKIILGQKDSGCLDFSKAGELGFEEAYKLIKKYCKHPTSETTHSRS